MGAYKITFTIYSIYMKRVLTSNHNKSDLKKCAYKNSWYMYLTKLDTLQPV